MNAQADEMDCGRWAALYAKRGFHVFPVNPATKHPYISDNLSRATTDLATIRTWWDRWPGAAVGVACGPSGIYVVDPDAGIGREMSLPALVDEHGDAFLETVTHESGGGGLGLFYQMPSEPLRNFQGARPGRPGEPLKPGPLGIGIDGRGDGGFIIVAPSRHPSGATYEWLAGRSPFDMGLAPMPEWMRARIAARDYGPGEYRAHTLADTLIERALGAVRAGGGRNDVGFWAACQLRDNGYDASTALRLLTAGYFPGLRPTNTKGELERYTERDIEKTVESAYRQAPRKAWGEDQPQQSAPSNHSSGPRSERRDERVLVFETAREFCNSVPAMVPWLLPGYFAAGAITEVGGKVKRAGKTTLVLAACAAIVRGEPFLELETKASPVVYLTEQSGSSFRAALQRAGLEGCGDFHLLRWSATVGMDWNTVADKAAAFAQSIGAGFLVVDTLGQFARIDGDAENSSGAALAAMRPLQEAAAAGLAVAVVRHERKSGGDVGDSTRGSSAFAGAVDIVLAVRRVEGSTADNVRVIHALSRFDETPDQLAIELGEDGVYRPLGDGGQLTARLAREFLLVTLPRDEDEACALGDLAQRTKIPRAALYAAGKELTTEGLVQRKGEGKRGSPFLFWRP